MTDREIERYVRECVRLALATNDPELRMRFIQLARRWAALAERQIELPDLYPPNSSA